MKARLLLTILMAVFLVGPGAALTAGSASAHDQLISTAPAKDATVATPPSDVLLTFNEPVLAKGSRVEVTGPAGRVDSGDATFVDKNVTQPLKSGLPAGKYDVVWRVTSSDGHPISGKFSFTAKAAASVASPSASSSAAAPSSTTEVTPALSSDTPAAQRDSDDEGNGINPWVYVGGAALVLILGGAWLASRRSSTPTHHTDE